MDKVKSSQLPDQDYLQLWKAVSLAKVRRALSLTAQACEQRKPIVIGYPGFGALCWLYSSNRGKGYWVAVKGLLWDILFVF